MLSAIVLDTTPLGLLVKGPGHAEANACRRWIIDCRASGITIYLPEIADYELRRELIRENLTGSIQRLDLLKATVQYLPITTAHMLHAAEMWATARNSGVATADRHALDGDVILCAQTLGILVPAGDLIVATANVKHLARFAPADLWTNIRP
jgi:predicted nucleic acid-binding protein